MVDERKVLEGYKVTEVGVIPEDWEVFKLGDIIDYTKGFAFKSSDYRKSGVRIIRVSDTDYDQIKDADEIYIDKSLSHKFKKWKLTEDDIILSTVGSKPPMYDSMVGKAIKVSLRHEGALLNQNAVKIISKNNKLANQTLIFYNLKTKRYLTNIEKIFRGNANQASITLLDLFKFEIPMPKCDKEQKAIAEALSDTDNLIQSLENLIDKKKKIKQGAMQQLLIGKKRLPGFSGEWEEFQLVELLDYEQPTDYIVGSTDYSVNGIPVLTPGKSFVLGYTNETSGIFSELPVIIFDDFTTVSKFVTFPFKVKSSAMKMLKLRDKAHNLRLIFEIMQILKFTIGDHKRYWISEYSRLKINLPSIEEQNAIAQVLSDMDNEIEALEEKLEKYKSIKQGMMQELLTGRIRLI